MQKEHLKTMKITHLAVCVALIATSVRMHIYEINQ
jgi:hypothetical protein